MGRDAAPSVHADAPPDGAGPTPARPPWLTGLLVGLAITAAATASVVVMSVSVRQVLLEDLRNYLRHTAESTAALIDGDAHARLTNPSQTNTPEYNVLVRPLEVLLQANPDIRFAYSGIIRGDEMFYVLDGVSSETRSHVMEPDAPTEGEREFMRSRDTVVERAPTETAWGSGIRAYAPLRGRDGPTGAYVGITMKADRYGEWLRRVYESAALGLGVAIVLGVFGGWSAYRAERARLRATRDVQRANRLAAQADREREELEQRLQQRQKLEALGTLASGVAHDFNNLLTVMLGNAELIVDGSPSPVDATVHATSIRTAALRARAVIRRILLFSSPQADTRQPVDLVQAIDETVQLLSTSIPSTVRLVWDPPVDPVTVVANASQVTQVLMNLGVNATQALRDMRGCVTFRLDRVNLDEAQAARRGLAPGCYSVVDVADDGIGMTREVRERVFDPFFTTRPHGSGTGLGLSVVDAVVRSHAGAVDVTSAEGAGTTFTVYLPLAPEPARPVTQPAPEASPAGPAAGQHLLLVDDDAQVLDITARVLRHGGYGVEAHSDAHAALDRFRLDPQAYAAVITDRTMPDLSGLELASQVRQARPGIPVVLLSGAPLDGDHLADQISIVLAKPASRAALLDAVAGVLSLPTP